jgi:hypothetical protein
MEPSRRAFLGLSAAALAAFALDPERLLWRPGARTIFLPSPSQVRFYLGATDKWGRIVRGRGIREVEYLRFRYNEVVWRDDTRGTEVSFKIVDSTERLGGCFVEHARHSGRVEAVDRQRGTISLTDTPRGSLDVDVWPVVPPRG